MNPIPEGTTVKVIERSKCGDPELDSQAGMPGYHYDVWDFAPEGSRSNDDPQGKAYYLLDDDHTTGGSHWAYPEHVEVVRTVKEKMDRKPPLAKAIRDSVASEVMGCHDPIDVDEITRVGGKSLLVSGRTADDLRVEFRIRIDQIEVVDP